MNSAIEEFYDDFIYGRYNINKLQRKPIEKYIIDALVDNKMKYLKVEDMKEILKNGIDGLNKLKKEELYLRYAELFGSNALVQLLKDYNC